MSGDVQPRKRKDKKKKKEEIGVEETRGTAAVFGEGDVFIHSQHDHGTGGHWCAKIIFFSLLAVLITLIGLIILENRGLSELEANAVESRYSGVLEGWLEDIPDDDHHDDHTLELNSPDDDIQEERHEVEEDVGENAITSQELDDSGELSQEEYEYDVDSEEEEDPTYTETTYEVNSNNYEAESSENKQDEEYYYFRQQTGSNKKEYNTDENNSGKRYSEDEDYEHFDDNKYDDDVLNKNDVSEEINSFEDKENFMSNNNNESKETQIENDDDHDAFHEDIELERLEMENNEDEKSISTELPALLEDDDEDKSADVSTEIQSVNEDDIDEEEYLEADDFDESPEQLISASAGKPLVEMEEEASSEKPPNTLNEEEEYELRQQELRREEEQSSNKDGGNSIEDDWPGEPNDVFWRQQIDSAERELDQGDWQAAVERASGSNLQDSARARYVIARALDQGAEVKRDNSLLSRAITAYLSLLKMNQHLTDKQLLEITRRTLDRIQFRGNYLNAEPVYRLLIRRFPQEPAYRNNLTISFLMANRPDLAESTIKDTLKLWPDDRVALAHHGFVLKTRHNLYEEAAKAFKKALEGDIGLANEARFYYHYGDTLLLLGRPAEAHEVHKRGAALGHFLSPSQRSLYNVNHLKSNPWWKIEDTPYVNLAKALERSWQDILKEGLAAAALYEQEKEGLKEKGDWSQLDLFVRGQEIPGRCKRAKVTCSIIKSEPAAFGCRRGQIKFSSMSAGTHVRPHVGPTNCRLRMHLGLSNTKYTYIRVDKEIRQWQTGKVFIFDDSFEHEVWHNGTGTRLVLIVDVWHPHLTTTERRQLPAI
ncbi:hypothetical protein ACJJTC_002822 [Scirpophaga incertulas]